MKPIRKLLSVIACGLFSYSATSAATTVSDSAPAQTDILATHISSNYPSGPGGSTDSFPTFNRAMWWFNYDIMDKNVLRPVVHGYVKWVPTPFRTGVSNFVDNLEEPNNIVNNIWWNDDVQQPIQNRMPMFYQNFEWQDQLLL